MSLLQLSLGVYHLPREVGGRESLRCLSKTVMIQDSADMVSFVSVAFLVDSDILL